MEKVRGTWVKAPLSKVVYIFAGRCVEYYMLAFRLYIVCIKMHTIFFAGSLMQELPTNQFNLYITMKIMSN